jgi:hypothetical protein
MNFPTFTESDGPSQCPQVSTTLYYPEPDESALYHLSCLCGLPNHPCLSIFPTNVLRALLSVFIRSACTAHPLPFDLVILITLGEEMLLWRSFDCIEARVHPKCNATARADVYFYVRFEVFTAVTMSNSVIWDKNPVSTSQETHYVSTTEPSQLMLCKI